MQNDRGNWRNGWRQKPVLIQLEAGGKAEVTSRSGLETQSAGGLRQHKDGGGLGRKALMFSLPQTSREGRERTSKQGREELKVLGGSQSAFCKHILNNTCGQKKVVQELKQHPPIICAERASIILHTTTWTVTAVIWFYILKNCQYKINCGVKKESQIHQPFHPLDAKFSRSSEVSKAKVWNSENFPQKKRNQKCSKVQYYYCSVVCV